MQIRCEILKKASTAGDVTRRDIVVAGALGEAGSSLASSAAPAAAAAPGNVTPVNIDAKETMQLGKSGTGFLSLLRAVH